MVHHKRATCRVCGGSQLRKFLSLGPMPLANSFLQSPDEFLNEQSYPLDVYFCKSCSLVQLVDVIDPEVLFRHYVYASGTSDTLVLHNIQYAQTMVDLLKLEAADLVVEVGSNNGSLLKCFQQQGVRTLGIDPATNIANIARENGIETLDQFFGTPVAQQVRESHGPAKAVVANNVLAHVDETRDFLLGCETLLEEHGLIVVEVPYWRDLYDRLEYDTIYHEHLCYFSVNALIRLCEGVGLSIVRLDHLPIHGGSLRMYAGRQTQYKRHAETVLAIAEEERALGMTAFPYYERFATAVNTHRLALLNLLKSLKGENKTVVGYGAPAKANTLLNYCGIDTALIPYTVDKSPLKINLYTPGTHIPVFSVSTLLEEQPDYVLILAWNFAEEIIQQQQIYAGRGGHFIIPIPEPRIV